MRPKAGTIHQMSAAAAADIALVYGPRLGSEKTGISPTRRPLLLLHSSGYLSGKKEGPDDAVWLWPT